MPRNEKEVVEKVLLRHRLGFVSYAEEPGAGYRLLDLMSQGAKDVSAGEAEIDILSSRIVSALSLFDVVSWPETPEQQQNAIAAVESLLDYHDAPITRDNGPDLTICQRIEAMTEEFYALGKRDGYANAVSDIDLMTGGDGEYRFCTGDEDRNTPDESAMKARIAERFSELFAAMIRSSDAES